MKGHSAKTYEKRNPESTRGVNEQCTRYHQVQVKASHSLPAKRITTTTNFKATAKINQVAKRSQYR
jgi:hypothetical protein